MGLFKDFVVVYNAGNFIRITIRENIAYIDIEELVATPPNGASARSIRTSFAGSWLPLWIDVQIAVLAMIVCNRAAFGGHLHAIDGSAALHAQ